MMEGKRITRSRNDRLVGGVAGGLANYFGIDPLIVRIGLLLLVVFNGMGALLYLVLWLLLPNEDSLATDTGSQVQENIAEIQRSAEQLVERIRAQFGQ